MLIFQFVYMENSRKVNWAKEEEYTHVETIQTSVDLIRGTGHSANLNQKMNKLWTDIAVTTNSIHGNHRDVKNIKKKWNNLKISTKSLVDGSCRETQKER